MDKMDKKIIWNKKFLSEMKIRKSFLCQQRFSVEIISTFPNRWNFSHFPRFSCGKLFENKCAVRKVSGKRVINTEKFVKFN